MSLLGIFKQSTNHLIISFIIIGSELENTNLRVFLFPSAQYNATPAMNMSLALICPTNFAPLCIFLDNLLNLSSLILFHAFARPTAPPFLSSSINLSCCSLVSTISPHQRLTVPFETPTIFAIFLMLIPSSLIFLASSLSFDFAIHIHLPIYYPNCQAHPSVIKYGCLLFAGGR